MIARARTSKTHKTRRLTVATLAIVSIALVSMIAGALPASASELALSGVVACRGGDHVITWTITNTDSSNTVTITSALTAKDPLSYDVTGYSPTLAPGATTHGTTIIPGSATGVVVLYVYETWANSEGSDHTALDLGDACSASTTTTTTTRATTTTTATTVASTTTVVPTSTTTVAAAGSTVTPTSAPGASATVSPTAQLPKTGGGRLGVVAGSITLVVGGLALALSGRKRRHARS